MPLLRYYAEAKRDLVDIGRYIATDNPQAAERLVRKIYEACDRLKDFPLSGPLHDEIMPGLRHVLVGNYIVLYLVRDNAVEILRVVHGKRSLTDIL